MKPRVDEEKQLEAPVRELLPKFKKRRAAAPNPLAVKKKTAAVQKPPSRDVRRKKRRQTRGQGEVDISTSR
jgi:hypothetical protein